MNSDDITIRETAQLKISNHLVGVSNIWERALPDQMGLVKARMSANASILNLLTDVSRNEKVFAGGILHLGDENYLVVQVVEGNNSMLGSILLRKI